MKFDKYHANTSANSDNCPPDRDDICKLDKCKLYEIDPLKLPHHVAIIMDGNGRWAKKRLLNRITGHQKGADTVRSIVTTCRELQIDVLTLYAFSTENWARPKSEVEALMELLKNFIVTERETLINKGICLTMIGQKNKLPLDVRNELDFTIAETAHNKKMCLNLALSYGGREEIVQAVRKIASKVRKGKLTYEKITVETVTENLYTGNLPDPDMVIRTSGEMRLSNFLLWQSAYSEFFFTQTLWPDFTEQEFAQMLREYQNRDRRFGKIVCSSKDGSQQ